MQVVSVLSEVKVLDIAAVLCHLEFKFHSSLFPREQINGIIMSPNGKNGAIGREFDMANLLLRNPLTVFWL
jgi:hypothetical protein